jgi:hypothetical protein
MKYRMHLLGPFKLIDPTGVRIQVTSKKSIALLGLLAASYQIPLIRTHVPIGAVRWT